MAYKGKMAWVPGDVLEELQDLLVGGMTVAEALRARMGLPARERENRVNLERRGDKRYDVMRLDLGEEVRFTDISPDLLSKIIKKQSRGLGREFTLNVTENWIQVIRTR